MRFFWVAFTERLSIEYHRSGACVEILNRDRIEILLRYKTDLVPISSESTKLGKVFSVFVRCWYLYHAASTVRMPNSPRLFLPVWNSIQPIRFHALDVLDHPTLRSYQKGVVQIWPLFLIWAEVWWSRSRVWQSTVGVPTVLGVFLVQQDMYSSVLSDFPWWRAV